MMICWFFSAFFFQVFSFLAHEGTACAFGFQQLILKMYGSISMGGSFTAFEAWSEELERLWRWYWFLYRCIPSPIQHAWQIH